ncbi:MAG: hypothetical protein GY810_21880 [Aureispira sp.]|nr:hypothetical protein [Aureispira sp.]
MRSSILLVILSTFFFLSSCSLIMKPDFRKLYSKENKILHQKKSPEALNTPFVKVHMNNGDVYVLYSWEILGEEGETLSGNGVLYNYARTRLGESKDYQINADDIAIIETNDFSAFKKKNTGRIAALVIPLSIGGAAILTPVLGLAALAIFGSCPTYYTGDNTTAAPHTIDAETFSNAISPSMERRDLDALNFSTPKGQKTFKLTLRNEALETHIIDYVKIKAIPKKSSEKVFHEFDIASKTDNYYVCNTIVPAQKVLIDNQDQSEVLRAMDNKEYFASANPKDLGAKQFIDLEFDASQLEQAGMVLRFRQSLLTTFLFYESMGYMGRYIADIFAKIEKNTNTRAALDAPMELLGKIDILVWDENKKDWELNTQFYELGPLAKNLQIRPLELSNIDKDKPLKIRLEFSRALWRLDYVALANIKEQVTPKELELTEVTIDNNVDTEVQELLKSDDGKKLNSWPGDSFVLEYKLPQKEAEYELFLESKGYYIEWMREEWLEKQNRWKLMNMLKMNKTTWRKLAKEYKAKEAELETLFWNNMTETP